MLTNDVPKRNVKRVEAVLSFRFIRANAFVYFIFISYLWMTLRLKLPWNKSSQRQRRIRHRINVRNSRRIHHTILKLRGIYIKAGQLISMMVNFLPNEYFEELKGLQDRVPAHDFKSIEKVLEKEYKQDFQKIFADFNQTPVASASLGQVHFAKLHNGEEVAVKIQYPEIDKIVDIDLKVWKRAFRILNFFIPAETNYTNIYDNLKTVISKELDYLQEGENLELIQEHFKDDTRIEFPKVLWDYTTRKVLVLQRMHGIKITDIQALKEAGIEPKVVARLLINSYFKQLLADGIYHADPHPGNFLVNPGPNITFLDFGAVETFPAEARDGLKEIVLGYMKKDENLVISGLRRMGFQSTVSDNTVFENSIKYYFAKVIKLPLTGATKIDVKDYASFKDLNKMQVSARQLIRNFQIPSYWFYMERTLLLLLGLVSTLDPNSNPIEMGFPFAIKYIFGKQKQ